MVSPSDSADLAAAESLVARVDSLAAHKTIRWELYTLGETDSVLRHVTTPPPNSLTVVSVGRLADGAAPSIHRRDEYFESGDGAANYVHYFDSAGRTLAFDRIGSWFGAGCVDVLRDHLRIYYSSSGQRLRTTREFLNSKMQRVDSAGCSFRYSFDSVGSRSYTALVAAKLAPKAP